MTKMHAALRSPALLMLGALGLAVVVPACGGAQPPPPITPPAPTATQVAPPAPPVDLSAVPDPPSLVVSGRLPKLSASFATVFGWTKLPMPKSEELTEMLTSEAIGPVIDLDQPVDFAVAMTGSGMKMKESVALSAAVKDPDKVKASLSERYKLVPGDNGVLLIQGLGKPAAKDDDDEDTHPTDKPASARTCELAPAFGAAPVRLVCGLTPKALTDLGPWLVRTATRGTSTGDMHVELHMKPMQPMIAEQRRLIGVLLGSLFEGRTGLSKIRDLAVAAGTDLADFGADLDGVALDVSISGAGADGTYTAKFSGTSSTLTRIITAHPERNAAAPAAFWQLPGDADVAFFGRGIDEAHIARARQLVLGALGEALGEGGLKEKDRQPILDALGKLVGVSPSVYAGGIDVDSVRRALAADKALKTGSPQSDKDEAKRQLAEEFLGWRVIAIEEPSNRLASALKELSAVMSRPSIVAAYRAKLKDSEPPALRPQPVTKTAGLPAATQHYLLELHSFERKATPPSPPVHGKPAPPHKPTPPLKPLLVHIFLVPDGERTWLAVGGDEGVVTSRLAVALGTSGDKLGAHPELAPLKEAGLGSGGFMTERGLPEAMAQFELMTEGATWTSREGFEESAQMPHQGLTPILFSTTPQAGGPPLVTVTRMVVPRAAIEDLVAEILKHGGF